MAVGASVLTAGDVDPEVLIVGGFEGIADAEAVDGEVAVSVLTFDEGSGYFNNHRINNNRTLHQVDINNSLADLDTKASMF